MNNRFGNERQRHDEFGQSRRDERSGWERGREEERSNWDNRGRDERGWQAESREPQYSSDYDETYGSEWDRDRGEPHRGGQQMDRSRSYGESERSAGWRQRGNVGTYGGGSGGGYVGGRGGGGYGGSSGTNYGGGNHAGYSGGQVRMGGGSQGGYAGGQGGNYSGGYSSRGYGGGGYGGAGGGYGGGGREAGFVRQRGFGGFEEGAGGSGFGGAEATRSGGFTGRGPKGYTRSDDRIREDVCDSLSLDDDVDASEIEVRVQNREVTLEGTVQTRSMKHRAEDIAEEVSGVSDVHNRLRVVKGILNELKDKVTGKESEAHYAHSGTKNTPATGTASGTNGRL